VTAAWIRLTPGLLKNPSAERPLSPKQIPMARFVAADCGEIERADLALFQAGLAVYEIVLCLPVAAASITNSGALLLTLSPGRSSKLGHHGPTLCGNTCVRASLINQPRSCLRCRARPESRSVHVLDGQAGPMPAGVWV